MKRLSIVIPAYNEAVTIERVLDRILEIELLNGIGKEVIIVNDCSVDNTDGVVREYMAAHATFPITYLVQPYNQGKGAAIRRGIREATGEYVVIQDADLEYDPLDYNALLKPMEEGYADVVYGSRFTGGKPHRILFFWHSIGNHWLTVFSNMCTNLNLTDMETCYKCFRRTVIQAVNLRENRFGFEPEVTAKVARMKVRIYEVGIAYYGRTYQEGKHIGWKDAVRTLLCILKYNFFD
jgi:glycosyltransferase involved in cell wall biosynthesis